MNAQAQATHDAYEHYCQLFHDGKSTLAEQHAAFKAYLATYGADDEQSLLALLDAPEDHTEPQGYTEEELDILAQLEEERQICEIVAEIERDPEEFYGFVKPPKYDGYFLAS